MTKDYLLLSEIALNPLNVKVVELTDQMISSFMTQGIIKPITVRPVLDFEKFPKGITHVNIDGDHRCIFLKQKMPKGHRLLIGSQVIIRNYETLLDAFTASCHGENVNKTWTAAEWFKFFEFATQLAPDAKIRDLAKISGASKSTVGEYQKTWKEASDEEKNSILSGKISVRQWIKDLSAGGQDEDIPTFPVIIFNIDLPKYLEKYKDYIMKINPKTDQVSEVLFNDEVIAKEVWLTKTALTPAAREEAAARKQAEKQGIYTFTGEEIYNTFKENLESGTYGSSELLEESQDDTGNYSLQIKWNSEKSKRCWETWLEMNLVPTTEGFQFKISSENITKFLCLKEYEPLQELIIEFDSKENLVTVNTEEEYLEVLKIFKNFSAYMGLDKDFKSVLKTYKNADIIKEFPETNGKARIDVVWKDLDDKQEFDLMLKKRKDQQKIETKATEDERTIKLTREQFDTLSEDVPDFIDERISMHQIVDDSVTVILKNSYLLMETIKWLFDHKDDYPLTKEQLKNFTDMSDSDIESIVSKGYYLTINFEEELLESFITNNAPGVIFEKHREPNHYQFLDEGHKYREVITSFVQRSNDRVKSLKKDSAATSEDTYLETRKIELTLQEYTIISELFSEGIAREEECNDGVIIYPSNWSFYNQIDSYLRPSREWIDSRLKDIIPFNESVKRNLFQYDFSWKDLKDPYPEFYRELLNIDQSHKDLKNGFSLDKFQILLLAVGRAKVYLVELTKDIDLLKSRRKIDNGKQQEEKICLRCRKPKLISLKKDLCGNCELKERQQQKKAVAAVNAGGSS